MAIGLELYKLTEGRAPIIASYGPPGTHKTLAGATLPPPILSLNWEQRAGSIMPWIRRSRHYNQSNWTNYSQEQRQSSFDLIDQQLRTHSPFKVPAPYIDVIFFDPTDPEAWVAFTRVLAEFSPRQYNGIVLDSLKEFSDGVQAFIKRVNYWGKTKWDDLDDFGRQEVINRPMEGKLWTGAQERAAIQFKRLKGLSAAGVAVYMISGEQIDKDYVTPPQGQEKGTKEDPYDVKGTIWVPGKLVPVAMHGVDIVVHTKIAHLPDGQVGASWSTEPEPIGGGSGYWWQAKDTYGRLARIVEPNFQKIYSSLYSVDGAKAIYVAAHNQLPKETVEASGAV